MEKKKTRFMVLQNGKSPGVCEEDKPEEKLTNSFTSKSILLLLVIIILQQIPHLRLNPLLSTEYFALTSEDQP